MSGLPRKTIRDGVEKVLLTPEMATDLLEHNKLNRPLRQHHVNRIVEQILSGKWRFNGDTIKIADTGDVLDGQHRLWAVIEAKRPVETYVVRGIAAEAFSTIDTLRATRTGSDVLALAGAERYRSIASVALQWLVRYQRNILERWRDPANRIENSDIEAAFRDNPNIMQAAEKCAPLRGVATPSTMAFLFYIIASRNEDLAERMVQTLINPAGVPMDDPFFRLRSYFVGQQGRIKDPLLGIALTIKATNAAYKGDHVKALSWRSQGDNPERFPRLEIGRA